MAVGLRIKRRDASGGVGAPSTLLNAEMAFNEANEILYYGKGTGVGGAATTVIAIAGMGAFLGLAGTQSVSGDKTFSGLFAPTATAGDSSTKVATTAFVQNALSSNSFLPLTGGAISGNLTVSGNLTIDGTTTTVNSTTISVDDKNIELGAIVSPTDSTANQGGITLKGATDKTLNWVSSTAAWTSSENIDLASGKGFYINGVLVLNSNNLDNVTIDGGTF